MDNNIAETVFNTLDRHTEEIGKVMAERDALEEKINSNRYTPQVLKEEVYPKREELRRKVRYMCDAAFKDAQSHIDQYKQDIEESNRLDPAQLTDDVKLLQPGIVLKPQDIQGMLKRNEDNRTMLQVILRYAEENNIDTGKTYYVGGQAEEENARNLEGILYYYKHWIDKPDGKTMLRKFFNVTEE